LILSAIFLNLNIHLIRPNLTFMNLSYSPNTTLGTLLVDFFLLLGSLLYFYKQKTTKVIRFIVNVITFPISFMSRICAKPLKMLIVQFKDHFCKPIDPASFL
jgi:hypothetical protein